MAAANLIYLRPSVAEKIDQMLGEKVEAVREGRASKGTVTLTLNVEENDDGDLCINFTRKGADQAKGDWIIEPADGQMTLDEAMPDNGSPSGGEPLIPEVMEADYYLPGYNPPALAAGTAA